MPNADSKNTGIFSELRDTRDHDEAEVGLRPRSLREFIGQSSVREKLEIYIEAARGRREPLDHILFYGPPGLGKTTLAGIIAHEMGGQLRTTTGPALERTGDLAAIVSNVEPNDVLFIDEIHRMPPQVEEILYPAMEDFTMHFVVGKGPLARTIDLSLPHFTLCGATTRLGLLTAPLRARFGIVERLDLYTYEELAKIALRASDVMNILLSNEAALEIARRSRGTPRVALRLLRRVRDVAAVKAPESRVVNADIAAQAMDMLDIDDQGLDERDRRLLNVLIELFDGGPVGLGTLAAALNEDAQTIETTYEPYLIQKGLLERTPKGRRATGNAWEYLGKTVPTGLAGLEGLEREDRELRLPLA